MRVEQAQLLAAMNGVERVVDIQHDPLGNLGIGLAIKIDHGDPCEAARGRQAGSPTARSSAANTARDPAGQRAAATGRVGNAGPY